MINKRAYDAGSYAAWYVFNKTSMPSPITMARPALKPAGMNMANVGGGIGNAPHAGAAPTPPASLPMGSMDATKATVPQGMGGAAPAPAPVAPMAGVPPAGAPAAPAAGGGWKGLAKDVGVQAAVPLAMMGVQNMMTPKDPNAP